MLRQLSIIMLLFVTTWSCLDPHTINIEGYESLLVVDGLITDEDKSHKVILRRTTSEINSSTPYEIGAFVSIKDNNGIEHVLSEQSPGVYITDRNEFRASIGNFYTLLIQTSDGNKYQSAPCEMLAHSEIESVYYKKNIKWDNNEEFENEGLSIYIDGKSNKDSYVRWLFEEDWKFKVPYPVSWGYDENEELQIIDTENKICWKNNQSININIHSFQNQVGNQIKSKEISFIPTGLSDKISLRYSILVKQLSISKIEYEYWNKLNESTESVGDVFGKQPFSIKGNIKNIENDSEPVLGFFQTGSVVSERLYINRSEILDLDIPLISPRAGCSVDSFMVDRVSYFSHYQIYEELVLNGRRNLYEPIFDEMGISVIGLMLSNYRCSDCTVTGSIDPPEFWEE